MSRTAVIVKNFKNLLWNGRYKRLQKVDCYSKWLRRLHEDHALFGICVYFYRFLLPLTQTFSMGFGPGEHTGCPKRITLFVMKKPFVLRELWIKVLKDHHFNTSKDLQSITILSPTCECNQPQFHDSV